MEAREFKIKVGRWRPRRANTLEQIRRQSAGEFTFAQGKLVFVLSGPSTDWTRPTHIKENSPLYSQPTYLHMNLIQNTLIETPKVYLTKYLGTCGPIKLTHKINHLPETPSANLGHRIKEYSSLCLDLYCATSESSL